MKQLLRLVAPVALMASSAPLTKQLDVVSCIPFSPSADDKQRLLVQTLRLSNRTQSSATIDLQKITNGDLGTFLRKGGSLVVLKSNGEPADVINRDTLDPSALVSDAGQVRLTAETPTASGGRASARPIKNPPLSKGAEIAKDWRLTALDDSPLIGADLGKRLPDKKGSPDGMQIDGFDGVAVPEVQIGTFNGIPARPEDGQFPSPLPSTGVQSAATKAVSATVAIYFREKDDPSKVYPCNGVQVAPGIILTNLHCALPRYVDHVVHFGSLHIQADTLLPGTPVSGSVRCRAIVVSPFPDQGNRLDFAVLRIIGPVPPPYDRAVVPIDDGSTLSAGAGSADYPATQIQYWMAGGAGSQAYQKYMMRPPQCAIKRDSGLTPLSTDFCNDRGLHPSDPIDPGGVGHSCDTEGGSSGSPLFDPSFGRLVALHRGGGGVYVSRNCAVPAARIRSQLTGWGYLRE